MQNFLITTTLLALVAAMEGPAWTRGETEKPAGQKDMGGWIANVYTKEQQHRLMVDEQGAPASHPQDRRYPVHWGEPPSSQTRDLRPLPGGYGIGSSTLSKWIEEKMTQDAEMTAEHAARRASPKLEWPELVGQSKEAAVAAIKSERPDLTIHTLPKDSMMTMDYCEDRVRVMLNEDGTVARKPRVG